MSTTAAMRGSEVPARSTSSTSGPQHLRREVVDDVPAEVFERVADRGSPGPGHAGDDQHLLLLGLPRGHPAPLPRVDIPAYRGAGAPSARRWPWTVVARAGPMPFTSAISASVADAEPRDRAEVPEQLLHPRRAEPRDLGEHGADVALTALALMRDRESVRFVADALEEEERIAVARQDDREVGVGQSRSLRAAWRCRTRWMPVDARLGEGARGRSDLRLAAVDDEQVRSVGELLRGDRMSQQRRCRPLRRSRRTPRCRRSKVGRSSRGRRAAG